MSVVTGAGAPGRNGLARRFASRFVAGETIESGVAAARELATRGITASLDLLGESVGEEREAVAARDQYLQMLDRMAALLDGLLRRRLNLLSVLFLVTAVLIFFGTISLPFVGEIPGLSSLVRPVIDEVFATAGARGILLGVALGTLVMGLRILFGIDRPYGGK